MRILLAGVAEAEAGLGGEAEDLQSADTFVEDLLVGLALLQDHAGHRALAEHRPGGHVDDGEEEHLGLAGLRQEGALAQGEPALERSVVGEKDLPVHLATSTAGAVQAGSWARSCTMRSAALPCNSS